MGIQGLWSLKVVKLTRRISMKMKRKRLISKKALRNLMQKRPHLWYLGQSQSSQRLNRVDFKSRPWYLWTWQTMTILSSLNRESGFKENTKSISVWMMQTETWLIASKKNLRILSFSRANLILWEAPKISENSKRSAFLKGRKLPFFQALHKLRLI